MTDTVDEARAALWLAVRGYGDAVRDVVEDRATFVAIDHAAAVVQTREDTLIAAVRAECVERIATMPNPYDEGSEHTAEAMLAIGFEKGRAACIAALAATPASPYDEVGDPHEH